MTPPVRRKRAPAGADLTRCHLVMRLADAPQPSIRQLAAELGFANPSAVEHHLVRLVEEGLLVRGRRLTLTPNGRTLATYLTAQANGEPSLRRLVRKHWGTWSHKALSALRAVARAQDATYWDRRGGLMRSGKDGSELERKASSMAILNACRRHSTLVAAAKAVGLTTGALEARVITLIRQARGQS